MDFSKLGIAAKKSAPIEPIKLFESLPSLENTPNDLWRGQAEALTNWHSVRNSKDILVSLNTGAGKTIVGLLIAQSLVNEGVENVIYVCSTIDLVNQTAAEAKRIGIPHTIRVNRDFSNDLFETAKSFCITTYQALFNGHSILRRKFFPGAVIFDDAHVAESVLRDAFTIRVASKDYPDLFKEISQLFEPHFKDLKISSRFKDSLSLGEFATAFAAPRGVHQRKEQLLQLFDKHNIKEDSNLTYAFEHIKDHIEACAAIFTRGVFELSPPFLPSLALDVFEKPVRRVYLSATLQSQTEFIRAFGRKPSEVVVPSNDAGNGERLIIDGRNSVGNFSSEYIKKIAKEKKIIIAVPSYAASEKWSEISTPPTTENFSKSLNDFRTATKGAFTLVSRVDGIDLPHDTCRLMLMDGLPSGTSLIERYQWEFLQMNNVHASRVANRVAQLFGRINRGRNDYGVFLIEGKDLSIWLAKDRNISLLPPLLQKQIMLGRSVQEGMSLDNTNKVSDAINSVLNRNETWLSYYEREIKLGELDQDEIERAELAEPFMVDATLAESQYAAFIWNGDYTKARQVLENSIDKVASADTPLGGWHGVWLGAAFDLEGDTDSAERSYNTAKLRIGSAIALPRPSNIGANADEQGSNAFSLSLNSYLSYSSGGKCNSEIAKLRSELSFVDSGTPNQAESSVRKLGEILGFNSTRPDNDQGTGPDVLWIDDENKLAIGFELKTDKESPATYHKKDISQGHDHLSWIAQHYQDYTCHGLLYIGPDGVIDPKANPSPEMGLCSIETIIDLRDKILAAMNDLMSLTPLERFPAITKESSLEKWTLTSLVKKLWIKNINAM
jgi:hypothetical protein